MAVSDGRGFQTRTQRTPARPLPPTVDLLLRPETGLRRRQLFDSVLLRLLLRLLDSYSGFQSRDAIGVLAVSKFSIFS